MLQRGTVTIESEERMPQFIAGLELSRAFYVEVVAPILESERPGLPYAAARIGAGSEVLGFDDAMSTDHDWGPRLDLVLREEDARQAAALNALLRQQLPHSFYGYSVSMEAAPDEPGVRLMRPTEAGPVNHRVTITTVRQLLREQIAYEAELPLAPADWLSISSQKLLELTAGAVYHDAPGELSKLRSDLAFYPRDIWLYLLAAGWHRIAQEEHLMPRAGYAGDELGSALIGSRLVRDIMALCFLIARRYAPYPKWFGTAFSSLDCAGELTPLLWRAQTAPDWRARERALGEALSVLARRHNALGLTAPLPEQTAPFHGRPFQVIHGDRFANALCARIEDPGVQRIATRRLIGGIDQLSDSTDLRAGAEWRGALRGLYTLVEL
jgi:hypothetical protein